MAFDKVLATDPPASNTEGGTDSSATYTTLEGHTVAREVKIPIKPHSKSFSSKFALAMFPAVMFLLCFAIIVITVYASTKTRVYVSEDEASLLVINSYPRPTNFSLMAMVCF